MTILSYPRRTLSHIQQDDSCEYDFSISRPTDNEMEWYLEQMYCDPAERE